MVYFKEFNFELSVIGLENMIELNFFYFQQVNVDFGMNEGLVLENS